ARQVFPHVAQSERPTAPPGLALLKVSALAPSTSAAAGAQFALESDASSNWIPRTTQRTRVQIRNTFIEEVEADDEDLYCVDGPESAGTPFQPKWRSGGHLRCASEPMAQPAASWEPWPRSSEAASPLAPLDFPRYVPLPPHLRSSGLWEPMSVDRN
ncbi:unnamed protein product, partial [Polarella glacialis]